MLGNGRPHGHSWPMNLAALTNTATLPDWISAISAAVVALGVIVAALGWTLKQAKQLRDPGEAPGGQEGEDKEFFEDVVQGWQGGSPQWWRDPQGGRSLLARWKRRLRRRGRLQQIQRAQRSSDPDED